MVPSLGGRVGCDMAMIMSKIMTVIMVMTIVVLVVVVMVMVMIGHAVVIMTMDVIMHKHLHTRALLYTLVVLHVWMCILYDFCMIFVMSIYHIVYIV